MFDFPDITKISLIIEKHSESINSQNYLDGYDIEVDDAISQHNISYTTAYHPGKNIYAIIFRGTDSDEWQGNFEIWDPNTQAELENRYTYSFYNAFLSTDNRLREEVEAKLGVGAKLWITGHSRGAAAANIMAKEYTDRYGQENIFAYTFATPNIIRLEAGNPAETEAEKQQMASDYQNIRNYVNTEDFVPAVPMAYEGILSGGWNYWKFGITEEFTSTEVQDDEVFINTLANLGVLEWDVSKGGKNFLCTTFTFAAISPAAYYEKQGIVILNMPDSNMIFPDASLRDFAYHCIGRAAQGLIPNTGLVYTDIGNGIVLLAFIIESGTVVSAHIPQTYYAWIVQAK